ncbi:MAG: helix-turn-helix transcriptional regulator [Armatimonadetes bacterium]|nr:helix-turn-helix transcriptional regulator [Armatimonadota bacterium]
MDADQPVTPKENRRNGPCAIGLSLSRVPAKRWVTRTGVMECLLKAKEMLDACPSEAVSLESLAKEVGLSAFHLQKLFKSVYGVSPSAYLSTARMDRARWLILHENRTATEACADVGFSSLASFTRSFRKRYGISPGTLRRGKQA